MTIHTKNTTSKADLLRENLRLYIATVPQFEELSESEKMAALMPWFLRQSDSLRKAEYIDQCIAKAMPRWLANYRKRYEW
jgi:hypothetical protein